MCLTNIVVSCTASKARKMNAKLCSATLINNNNNKHDSGGDGFKSYLNNRVMDSIFLSPTSSDEVLEIIKNFENDKASDISIVILKKCAQYISGHLSGFLNEFINSGMFPDIYTENW